MRVLVWIAPGTWPAVVEAARQRPADDELILLAVADPADADPLGPLGGLMGRARPTPERQAEALTRTQAEALLDQARTVLGRPCRTTLATGRTERVVTAAAEDADWLILARDGDPSRLGPHSLGRHARFVIDHAPCVVQLIWPEQAPDLATIPPAPTGEPPRPPGRG